MKLTTFTYHGMTRPGVVMGDEILDAATVPDLPQDMIGLLEAGAPALNRLREYIGRVGRNSAAYSVE